MADKLYNTHMSMESQVKQYNLTRINQQTKLLDKKADEHSISIFSRETAKQWLIETAQDLKDNFDGKLVEGIKEKDGTFQTKVEFNYTPDTPENFLKLLYYLENLNEPVIVTDKIEYVSNKTGDKFIFHTILTIPYIGGDYKYELP